MEIRGEMGGVVSLCSNLAMSNRAHFADNGVPLVNVLSFLCNKWTRSSAVFLMWSFKEACGIGMLDGIMVAVSVIRFLCVLGI